MVWVIVIVTNGMSGNVIVKPNGGLPNCGQTIISRRTDKKRKNQY